MIRCSTTMLAVISDCNDDTDQAKWGARRGALFRGATPALRPALVRRLHGSDTPKSRPLWRVRTAREVRGRHALRPRRLAGWKARGVDDVPQASDDLRGRPAFALRPPIRDSYRYDRRHDHRRAGARLCWRPRLRFATAI